MNSNDREIEVKFYLSDPAALIERLAEVGAVCTQPRLYEINLRFDQADGELTREHRVLRLRQDKIARMTYKGPAAAGEEVSVRQEIEFVVSDFEAARRLLEALGYQVSVMYEKWRATYKLGSLEIVVDEMPFGNFCEIEGLDAASIQQAAINLGLNWDCRINVSYLALFEQLKQSRQLEISQLSFSALEGLNIQPQDLGVQPADIHPN
jgi:adenylate cyclase class 2